MGISWVQAKENAQSESLQGSLQRARMWGAQREILGCGSNLQTGECSDPQSHSDLILEAEVVAIPELDWMWIASESYGLLVMAILYLCIISSLKNIFLLPPPHRHAFFFPKCNWSCPWANPTIPWFRTPCDFIEDPLYLVLLKHSLYPWFLKIQLQPLSISEAIVDFHYILLVISWQSYEHIILFFFFPILFLPSIFSSREYLDKREEQRQAREERFVSLFFHM